MSLLSPTVDVPILKTYGIVSLLWRCIFTNLEIVKYILSLKVILLMANIGYNKVCNGDFIMTVFQLIKH